MTVKKLKEKKLEKGYSNAQVSQMSGIPLGTVQKIFSGETLHPRFATLFALQRVLLEPEDEMSESGSVPLMCGRDYKYCDRMTALCDNSIHFYEKRREKEMAERRGICLDEICAELEDNMLSETGRQTFTHQKIVGELYRQIANYVIDCNENCEVGIAPVDVQLDWDDKNLVQPDIFIICDRKKNYEGKKILGAPDFILEVVSESTKRRDYFTKLARYESTGVREYWIVDPRKMQLLVFFFEKEIYAQVRDFSEMVPVYISEGKLEIQFKHIRAWCEEISHSSELDT